MAQIRLSGIRKRFGGRGATPLGAPADAGPQSTSAAPLMGSPGEETRDGTTPVAGAIHAVDGVDLTIENGETISIVGPSGCGKTTLLRIIAGLEQPDEGQVFFGDRDVTNISPAERNIGMVFQNYALYPHMKSRGNLSFFFMIRKREGEVDERVRITSEIMGVGFDQLLDRKPKQLSGGQQQRVAIARCIVRDPEVFLFDEPLSNLDAKLRSRTRVEVKRLLHRFKITSVYVTHDQIEAVALGDRIAVMRRGKVEQLGTYWEITERPINRFVAGFLGLPAASFIDATVVSNQLVFAGGALPLPERARERVREGQQIAVGFRPDMVRVLDPGEAGHASGRIDVIEPLVAERVQLLHLDIGGQMVTARIDQDVAVARGDTVPFIFDPEKVLLFDGLTEANLMLDAVAR